MGITCLELGLKNMDFYLKKKRELKLNDDAEMKLAQIVAHWLESLVNSSHATIAKTTYSLIHANTCSMSVECSFFLFKKTTLKS